MIRNIVGPPARGDDFFDREEFVRLLWERLEAGNILLAAPRRFGKTSVMYRLLDHPKPGWKPVHVDAESIREPINFIIALLDALLSDRYIRNFLVKSWKGTTGWLKGLIDKIEVSTPWDVDLKIQLKDQLGADWQDRGQDLLKALRGLDAGQKPLIIIDELPVMLNLFRDSQIEPAEIRAFLYWFRKLRTDPQIGLTNCRFLVGGSIGIENLLAQVDAQASFNDFERLVLSELGDAKAKDFLRLLLEARGIELSPRSRKELLDLVGAPIPYFLQVFVTELATDLIEDRAPVGPKRLEGIYQTRVLGPSCKTYFEHYYNRLRQYTKTDEQAAKAVLKELALRHPEPVHRDALYALYRKTIGEPVSESGFNRLIGDLENDFYIRGDADRLYRFASKILCDWWRRYYAF